MEVKRTRLVLATVIFVNYITIIVSSQIDDVIRVKRADDTNVQLEQLIQQVSSLTAELNALKNSVAADVTTLRNSLNSEAAARQAADGKTYTIFQTRVLECCQSGLWPVWGQCRLPPETNLDVKFE